MGDDRCEIGREEIIGGRLQHHEDEHEEEETRGDDEPLTESMILEVSCKCRNPTTVRAHLLFRLN